MRTTPTQLASGRPLDQMMSTHWHIPGACVAAPGAGFEPGPSGAVACKPGFFKKTTGNFKCSPCPAGTIQPGSGHTGCVPCHTGRTNNAAHTFCSETLPAFLHSTGLFDVIAAVSQLTTLSTSCSRWNVATCCCWRRGMGALLCCCTRRLLRWLSTHVLLLLLWCVVKIRATKAPTALVTKAPTVAPTKAPTTARPKPPPRPPARQATFATELSSFKLSMEAFAPASRRQNLTRACSSSALGL